MVKGEMGHLYPEIDTNKCIECGRCMTVCPALNRVDLHPILKAYAAWAIDEKEYKTSISGGVASVLSRYIIQQNGVVYGCAMLPNIIVKHIRIDKEEDLALLKGSKYVQSDIFETIPQLKNDVRENKKVLFIGTPCQVAAIRRLYKEQPANLYLVDLICHGVPSLHTLKRHIHKVAASNSYHNISFRSKCNYCLEVTNGDGTIYSKPLKPYLLGEDTYLGTFYHGYTFRDSCYSCQYADSLRVGDITIGDFWGLDKWSEIKEVKYMGFVEDLKDEYREARIVVVPIYGGAGTNIKVLEAMQMRRPCVTTTYGVRGFSEYFSDSKELLIAEDDMTFAEKVVALMNDEKHNHDIATKAYYAMKAHFSRKAFNEIVKQSLLNTAC